MASASSSQAFRMPPRSPSPSPGIRSPTPPPIASDSPRVGDAQGSMWRPAPLQRVPGPQDGAETYSFFRPEEVLSSPYSVRLRRLEAEVVDLRLDDVYEDMAMPWQVNRKDVNGPFGNEWSHDTTPDFWVSTDTGKVCFAALQSIGATSSTSTPGAGQEQGQFHKEVGESWHHFAHGSKEIPGDVGGFHCCCVDTGKPDAAWTLVAKLADFGQVMGRDAGMRVEFAALVRDDCEAIIASVGPHDECRSLFCVDQVALPTGRLLLADPAELGELGCDGPAVPSGLGAGLYPVYISRDGHSEICRVTAVFHPARADKVCTSFAPVANAAPPAASPSASPGGGRALPPKAPVREASRGQASSPRKPPSATMLS